MFGEFPRPLVVICVQNIAGLIKKELSRRRVMRNSSQGARGVPCHLWSAQNEMNAILVVLQYPLKDEVKPMVKQKYPLNGRPSWKRGGAAKSTASPPQQVL